jgi:hypothetical protein
MIRNTVMHAQPNSDNLIRLRLLKHVGIHRNITSLSVKADQRGSVPVLSDSDHIDVESRGDERSYKTRI